MISFPGEEHLKFWLERLAEPRFVYVIQSQAGTPIKIGRAIDVRARIRSLQTGSPFPLRLLFAFPGDHDLEWQYHQKLKDCRLQGEWFAPRDPDQLFAELAELSEYLIATYDGSGQAPDFKQFGGSWFMRPQSGEIMTVRFVDPATLADDPQKAAERRARDIREATLARARQWRHSPTNPEADKLPISDLPILP